MDICANVQYNKVLEADPLELLEVGCGALKAAAESQEVGRGREMKANLKLESFQFSIADGYNQFQFASNRFNSKSKTNLIQIRNSEQI